MDYCLLVALSRDSIRFYYNYPNRPDEFISMGSEPVVMPLAVWFNGNDVVVGQEALQQAQSQYNNGTAFYHLFDQMEKPGHFNFNGQEHSYNKLVLFAIKAGLTPFFTKVKYGELGDLNQNIGIMPLVVMMENDIPDTAQTFIMNQLGKNGFGNILQVDPCQNLLRTFDNRINVVGPTSVVISSGGSSLDISFFTGNTLREAFHIPEANVDPRLEVLARSIWDNSTASYDYLLYENESDVLMQVALSFLISNRQEMRDSVRLSNGKSYAYFLSRNQLNFIQNDRGSSIVRMLIDKVETLGGSAKTATLILSNRASSNGYIIDLLQRDFPHIIVVKDEEAKLAQKNLLDFAKSKNFDFRDNVSISNLPPVNPETPKGIPTPADNRRRKILRQEVQTHLGNGAIQQASMLVEVFENDMHQRNISGFDDEITDLRALIAKHRPAQPEPIKKSEEPVRQVPSTSDNKALKILRAEVKTLLAKGSQSQAKKKCEVFLKEMHAKGVMAFDPDVQALIDDNPTVFQPTTTVAKRPSASEPTPRDNRDYKALERTVDTKIAIGDLTSARAAIKEFGDAMAKRGITSFDGQIKMLRDKVSVSKNNNK